MPSVSEVLRSEKPYLIGVRHHSPALSVVLPALLTGYRPDVLLLELPPEFTDWLPWLAARLIRAAARTLPPAVRTRYTGEWLAELDAVPGKLSKLALAVRVFVRAPATAMAISGLPSFKAMTVKLVL